MKTSSTEYLAQLAAIQSSTSTAYLMLPSDEPRFIIDSDTRKITIPDAFTFLGLKNDTNAETIYFEIDRYFDRVDLSKQTCVVQWNNGANSGIYTVDSMDVTTVPGKVIFGWIIRNDVTAAALDVSFSVRFYTISGNAYTYNFNTLLTVLPVKDTLDVAPTITIPPSEVTQLESIAQQVQMNRISSETAAASANEASAASEKWAESDDEWSEQSAAVGGGSTTVWHKSAKGYAADSAASALTAAAQINVVEAEGLKQVSNVQAAANTKASAPTVTVTQNPITKTPLTITTDRTANNLIEARVYGSTTQSGTGDPSPTNIRAISGVGCDKTATIPATGYTYNAQNGSFYKENAIIDKASASPVFSAAIPYVGVFDTSTDFATAAASYTYAIGSAESANIRGRIYIKAPYTTTTDLDTWLSTINKAVWYKSTSYATASTYYIVTEVTDDSGYHAHAIQTTSPLFAGDYADVATGNVHRVGMLIDLGSLTWILSNGKFLAKAADNTSLLAGYVPSSLTVDSGAICTALKCVSWSVVNAGTTNYTVAFYGGSSGGVFAYDTDYTTAAAFKSAMSGVQMWFPLAAGSDTTVTGNRIAIIGKGTISSENTMKISYNEDSVQAMKSKAGCYITEIETSALNPAVIHPDETAPTVLYEIIDGSTTQLGTGVPSTSNIRAICGIGKYDKSITFDGSADEKWTEDSTDRYKLQIDGIITGQPYTAETATELATSNLFPWSIEPDRGVFWTTYDGTGLRFVPPPGITSVAKWRELLTVYPLTVWYRSTSYYKSSTYYSVVWMNDRSGDQSHSITLSSPLFSNDSANFISGRIVRYMHLVTLTGNETYMQGTGNICVRPTSTTLYPTRDSATLSDNLCSHYPVGTSIGAVYMGTNGVIYLGSSLFAVSADGVAAAKAYAAAQYAAGTPIQYLYKMSESNISTVTTGNIVNINGEATVSGESTIYVTYNKPISDAIYEAIEEEANRAIAAEDASAANIATNATNIATNTADISQLKSVKAGCLVVTESGNPLTIYPDATSGALAAAKVQGLTTQAGTGTPSPTNVRAISGVGPCDSTVTFNGTENWRVLGGTVFYFNYFASHSPAANYTVAPLSSYLIGKLSASIPVGYIGISSGVAGFTVNISGISTVDALKIYLAAHPLTIWYKSTSYATASTYYIVSSMTDATGYHAYAVQTTAPLFTGDWVDVVSGTVHRQTGYIASYAGEALPGAWISDRDAYSAGATPTTGAQVLYQLATPTDTAGTGNAITVSGDTVVAAENTVAVTYNKSLIAKYAEILSILSAPNAGAHNSIYRGKDITANVTDGSFYTHISDGTFQDIYVGDYFTKSINGTNYVIRIAGCDVYWNRGDSALTTHHVVVVPDASFGSYVINATNITDGGYVGSVMYTDTLVTWAGYLDTAFGSHLIVNKELLTNAVSGGLPSNWSWYSSKVNLMTSEEVVGHAGFGVSGSNYAYNIGIAYGQLPLFRLAPDKICTRYTYWLRNITGSTAFADVTSLGNLNYDNASNSIALRPRFLLG